MRGQYASPEDAKTPWQRVDDVAAAARTEDEPSIRALTDWVLNLALGSRATQSIRDRVFAVRRNPSGHGSRKRHEQRDDAPGS